MNKEKETCLKIKESTLVNILEMFVMNAPDIRVKNETVNQRFDATSVTTKWCHFYMSDINFIPKDDDYFPKEIRYKITMRYCYGVQILIEEDEELIRQKSFRFDTYYDDGWCYGTLNNKNLSRGRYLSRTVRYLILKILETGTYHKHEEVEDYPMY